MPAPTLFGQPFLSIRDAFGVPIAGALIRVYQAGSSTPQLVYQDGDLTIPWIPPIVTTSAGITTAPIYVVSGIPLKIDVTTATGGTVPGYPVDDWSPPGILGVSTPTTDMTKPTVTVEQAANQSDPTSTSPIHFTATFSENVTGFATGDVTLSGTAGATTATVSGGPRVFTIAASGMSGSGTVLASIGAGVAQDASGNTNDASTSSDHTVTFSAGGGGGGGGGGGSPSDLTFANFTQRGAFYPPDYPGDAAGSVHDNATPGNLAVTHTSGEDRLFMWAYNGKMLEFTPGTPSTNPASFGTGVAVKGYPDVFGTKLRVSQGDVGYPSPPYVGLSQSVRPVGIFFDEAGGDVIYGTRCTFYTNDASPWWDTQLSRATINRSTGASTGDFCGTLAYSYGAGGGISNGMTNWGGRWFSGLAAIPAAFQAQHCPNKRLMMGYGLNGVSVATNGPIQVGLGAEAFDPAALVDGTVLGGEHCVKLAGHPFQTFYPSSAPMPGTKAGAFPCLEYDHLTNTFHTEFNDYLSVNRDRIGPGAWIDGPTRQGLVMPVIVGAGNCHATITASTGLNATINQIGDTLVGDTVWTETPASSVYTNSYPFSEAVVSAITDLGGGSWRVDFSSMINLGGNDPGPCTIGGYFHTGNRYKFTGGPGASRYHVALMIFSIADLGKCADGTLAPDLVNPIEVHELPLSGVTQPFHGTLVRIGLTYAAMSKKLYVWCHWFYVVANFGYNTIEVFDVDC